MYLFVYFILAITIAPTGLHHRRKKASNPSYTSPGKEIQPTAELDKSDLHSDPGAAAQFPSEDIRREIDCRQIPELPDDAQISTKIERVAKFQGLLASVLMRRIPQLDL